MEQRLDVELSHKPCSACYPQNISPSSLCAATNDTEEMAMIWAENNCRCRQRHEEEEKITTLCPPTKKKIVKCHLIDHKHFEISIITIPNYHNLIKVPFKQRLF